MNNQEWIQIVTKGDEKGVKQIQELLKQNHQNEILAIMEHRKKILHSNRNINLDEIFVKNIDDSKKILQELFLEFYDDNQWEFIVNQVKERKIKLTDIFSQHLKNPTYKLMTILKLV